MNLKMAIASLGIRPLSLLPSWRARQSSRATRLK